MRTAIITRGHLYIQQNALPKVILTQGRVSIRRGRVTRQYPTLTKASFSRLTRTCGGGPTDYLTTNRSAIYIWHGLSTLTADQRKLYDLWRMMRHETFRGADELWILGYLRGIEAACEKVGIHKLLLHPDLYGTGIVRYTLMQE